MQQGGEEIWTSLRKREIEEGTSRRQKIGALVGENLFVNTERRRVTSVSSGKKKVWKRKKRRRMVGKEVPNAQVCGRSVFLWKERKLRRKKET